MNKPLSRETRALILRNREEYEASREPLTGRGLLDNLDIWELIEAEAFWREAVKNANHAYGRGVWDAPVCNFCNAELSDDGGCEETCAYMIAQES